MVNEGHIEANSSGNDRFKYDKGKLYQFVNCRILRQHKIFEEDFWVRDGIIMNPEKIFFDEKKRADYIVNCNGCFLFPGLIDLQINGAFGRDFSLAPENICDNIDTVAKGLLAHGVTSFCPTIVTSTPDLYIQILARASKKKGGRQGAGVIGLHLEGPFISKEMKGAHEIECISSFEDGIETLHTFYGHLDNIAIVTLAPELSGALDVIGYLSEKGVVVSLGHSSACLSVGEQAVKRGARFITHLFNAMLPFHHRDPHLVGLLSAENTPKIYYGIIADGIHTHPAALRIAQRSHPKGIVLVTDAISAMGLQEGIHHLGKQVIDVTGNRAVIAGTNTLCGSIASLDQCVRYFHENAANDIIEAVEAATLHPALVLKIQDRKGTLDFGTDADFILLDDNLHVQATFIAGDLVWKKDDFKLESKERI